MRELLQNVIKLRRTMRLGHSHFISSPPQNNKNKTTVCYRQEYDVSSTFRAVARVINSVVLNPAPEFIRRPAYQVSPQPKLTHYFLTRTNPMRLFRTPFLCNYPPIRA